MAYQDLNSRFTNKNIDDSTYQVLDKSSINELYPTVANIESIKQGLLRLLTTPKGHDPFNREYGSSLYNLLFENRASSIDAIMFLYMDITDWEPRITLSPADISITKIDPNTYTVYCNFIVNEYNVAADINTTITRE